MSRRILRMKDPIFVAGHEITVVYQFVNGNFAGLLPGESILRQFDKYGRALDEGYADASNYIPTTTEVITLYPHGAVYVKGTPVQSSSFGVDQLIQVRVTRQGDRIIRKELLP